MITSGDEVELDKDRWAEEAANIPAYAHAAVRLYRRCQMFKEIALPEAGGILDQTEKTVRELEVVHKVIMEYRDRKQRDAQFKAFANMHRMDNKDYGGGRVRRRGG